MSYTVYKASMHTSNRNGSNVSEMKKLVANNPMCHNYNLSIMVRYVSAFTFGAQFYYHNVTMIFFLAGCYRLHGIIDAAQKKISDSELG